KRYGTKCAVCEIRHPQLLKAAHIRGKAHSGSDDWRNGIILCATHHDAYDAHLFAIEPQTMSIRVSPKVSSGQIGIEIRALPSTPNRPHDDALNWRWQHTLNEWRRTVTAANDRD